MIANLLDRAWLPVWRFLEWLYPLDVSVRRGVDACPVAGVAAGQSVGVVSDSPLSPTPTRPDLLLQAMAIEELYAHHQPDQDSPSTIRCHGCGHIAHSERRHWRHVTELVTDMVTTDYRIQQLLNK